MECISMCMDRACLWEHQNSLDQSDMRYIEQVPSDVCYWVVLSTPKGVNHIDRLNYISRDIFLPSSKGHLQSRQTLPLCHIPPATSAHYLWDNSTFFLALNKAVETLRDVAKYLQWLPVGTIHYPPGKHCTTMDQMLRSKAEP